MVSRGADPNPEMTGKSRLGKGSGHSETMGRRPGPGPEPPPTRCQTSGWAFEGPVPWCKVGDIPHLTDEEDWGTGHLWKAQSMHSLGPQGQVPQMVAETTDINAPVLEAGSPRSRWWLGQRVGPLRKPRVLVGRPSPGAEVARAL